MDSPGHVDFSSEVSSALRLSDGALVLVDVVEGVSPQTHTVLRQAWEERVRTCLVLNKVDRLILEMDKSPEEIYLHLQNIIEQANAVISELISSDYVKKGEGAFQSKRLEQEEDDLEERENACFFSPVKGNVAFSSAIDCWAFTIEGFAKRLAEKMGMNPRVLQKYLWGDYYYSNKKVTTKPPSESSRPMLV